MLGFESMIITHHGKVSMRLPSRKSLKLSAEVFAKSFNISKQEAIDILVKVFNANNWESLLNSCQSEPVELSLTERKQIDSILWQKISDIMDLSVSYKLGEYFVSAISPYNLKPKVFRYDVEQDKLDKEGSIPIGEMFDSMLGSEEELKDSLIDMLNGIGSEAQETAEWLQNNSMEDIQKGLRLNRPVDAELYWATVDVLLGWKTNDDCDEASLDHPSFNLIDKHGELHPVFVNGCSITPGDSPDFSTVEVILNAIDNSWEEEFEKPIVMLSSGASKKIGGKTFCVIGIHWNPKSEEWHWLFLCDKKPDEQLKLYPHSNLDGLENTLEEFEIPEELAVPDINGVPMNVMYHCAIMPTENPWSKEGVFTIRSRGLHCISGIQGWSSFI